MRRLFKLGRILRRSIKWRRLANHLVFFAVLTLGQYFVFHGKAIATHVFIARVVT